MITIPWHKLNFGWLAVREIEDNEPEFVSKHT